jgi:hypothetical protein
MRIYCSMHHLGSFLVYEPVIRELAGRGHDMHLAVSRAETLGWEQTLQSVLVDHPNITWSWLSPSPLSSSVWFELAKTIRIWAGYLRYFEPEYADAPRLKERAEQGVPPGLVRLSARPIFRKARNRQRLLRLLRLVERTVPPVPEVQQALREYNPDLVFITPLVYLGSWQFEVLRTALAEGLRTAFGVGSWDHLSSKALIRDIPQRVLVWNETQKDEAMRLHGVPADRIVVTGAQCYDRWFDRAPVRSREEFCRRVGLPHDRPFILYVCSALFWGSPVEAEFVRRWIQELRASGHPVLRSAAVLIRPHPARLEEWKAIDLSSFEGVSLYGSNPKDPESREDYFESLFYSSAVAGLNTSAFIEAAVVGRPVHTVLAPEYHDNQEGTLHFHYLTRVGGGVLHAARTVDEHHALLAASLQGPAGEPGTNPQFVREFVRPFGLDRAATPILCEALEELGRMPAPAPVTIPRSLAWLRSAVYPMAVLLQRLYGGAVFRDVERLQRQRDHERGRELEAERRRTEKIAARAEKIRRVEAAREAERRSREERLAASARAKSLAKAARERHKARHRRSKRRAAFVAQIKRRMGFGQ